MCLFCSFEGIVLVFRIECERREDMRFCSGLRHKYMLRSGGEPAGSRTIKASSQTFVLFAI